MQAKGEIKWINHLKPFSFHTLGFEEGHLCFRDEGENWNRSSSKGTWEPWEDLQEDPKMVEFDLDHQIITHYCYVEWLTTYSNLDECVMNLGSDDRNAASFFETFYYCPS